MALGAVAAPERIVAASPTPTPLAAPFLTVPLGEAIVVRLTDRLSSQDARVGDTFGFETANDVRLGALELPAHTKGRGHVVEAESGRGAHGGRLAVAADELDLASGRVAVAMKIGGAPERDSDRPHLPIPVLVDGSLVLVGPNGGAQNNVVFEKGTTLTVVTVSTESPLPLPT
jgi:hypothetical protein